jgi:ribosomal protein S18 acetylase RimI-like enzyme
MCWRWVSEVPEATIKSGPERRPTDRDPPVNANQALTMLRQDGHERGSRLVLLAGSKGLAMPVHLKTPKPFAIRDAEPVDIAGIMRLKLELAISDDIVHTVRATAADWERDAFGAKARFTIFVADHAGRVIGMAICADRYFPGWVGVNIALLDLCVEADYRGHGVGAALLARVAEFAKSRDAAMIELTMRVGNRAAHLYERVGFMDVTEVRNYVIAGDALDRLAAPAAPPRRMAG